MVEVPVGVSCAIGSDKQISTVEIRCICGQELYLYRELSQTAWNTNIAVIFFWRKALQCRTRTSETAASGLFLLVCLYRLFVISRRFTLGEVDSVHRTGRETVTEAVAEIVTHELSLAVHNSDRSLMASLSTQTAAVAFFFVYFNYFQKVCCNYNISGEKYGYFSFA